LLSVLSRVGSRFSLAAGAAIVLLSLGATPASALGDYAATGSARLALIDEHSYYIYG